MSLSSPEKFSKTVIDTIAKRASNICSNIDCAAITSGPAETEAKAINVGEAAHIYGARPGSSRFNERMSDIERSDIMNAIWLCRNCHKIIDSDASKFPPELLFEWRREHEDLISKSLGKAGVVLLRKALRKRFIEFDNCSYLAQQIIIEKPFGWEQKLTAELLFTMLEPVKLRWEALDKGLYAYPNKIISFADYIEWHRCQMDNLLSQTHALGEIINKEIQIAWGPIGQPGSEVLVYRACALIVEACQRILEWEETVRFLNVSEEFRELSQLLVGIAGIMVTKIFDIPLELLKFFAAEKPGKTLEFMIVFEFPPGWVEKHEKVAKKAIQAMNNRADY